PDSTPHDVDQLTRLSFPTRRSSDLNALRHLEANAGRRGEDLTDEVELGPGLQAIDVDVATETQRIYRAADHALEVPDARKIDERSEEHTSELQSRENLVCRLLLEKK